MRNTTMIILLAMAMFFGFSVNAQADTADTQKHCETCSCSSETAVFDENTIPALRKQLEYNRKIIAALQEQRKLDVKTVAILVAKGQELLAENSVLTHRLHVATKEFDDKCFSCKIEKDLDEVDIQIKNSFDRLFD